MARPKKKKAPPQPPPCTATSSTSSAIDPPAESQAAASDIDVQENQSDIVPTTPSISLSQATRGSELGKQPSNTENDSDQPSKKRSRGRCNSDRMKILLYLFPLCYYPLPSLLPPFPSCYFSLL
ncbi:hypothetical protein PGT21_015627 [Puccinia graminis f. sp. tritici]|uniref:Uncharacterized protein n=1 Tax=Puccinia graminis f. sp. tritici TaxID=56615 RepID=A0A5B0SCA7_PUCGR|nr:hypothetical protein PGT21_008701 [Puccinia graminis f. sp. tritici]KAA1092836.1 hypothetical protein PGT21_015627 [Puccinia graminis f. sp. tritici]KAA1135482.1 hypothetical protein PGTUg99_001426 [Puccinia graminis f. sp. tritici]